MPNRTPLPDLAADLLIDVQVAIASGQTDRAVTAAREAARVVAQMNRNRLRWIYEANFAEERPDAA